MTAPSVVLVTFLSEKDPDARLKILGVYANEDDARAAIARAKSHPAFAGAEDFFWLDAYEIGKDDWLSQ